jgi:hypothetical protein
VKSEHSAKVSATKMILKSKGLEILADHGDVTNSE